jgi:hypothetical protein
MTKVIEDPPHAEPPASAYFIEDRHDPEETHTLSVLVDSELGVPVRVARSRRVLPHMLCWAMKNNRQRPVEGRSLCSLVRSHD